MSDSELEMFRKDMQEARDKASIFEFSNFNNTYLCFYM